MNELARNLPNWNSNERGALPSMGPGRTDVVAVVSICITAVLVIALHMFAR
ncbi:hypothetical protein [Enterococcus faecium]|uniref:hypothetical protein n=1 Tax=Enterococcus faecium TaxID=1352 RepID=UPI0025B1D886|nr:hypothetical protein [Enterococcus faecium]